MERCERHLGDGRGNLLAGDCRALLFTGCVTLGKLLTLSVPQFLVYKRGVLTVFSSWVGGDNLEKGLNSLSAFVVLSKH